MPNSITAAATDDQIKKIKEKALSAIEYKNSKHWELRSEAMLANDQLSLIARIDELKAACKEALIVVDECYEATGHIKVCKTSTQRMKIESALQTNPAPPGGKE